MVEVRTVWMLDFNGTYALGSFVLPRIHKQTVGGTSLTQQEYNLLKQDIPDMETWRILRPANPDSDLFKYNPNALLKALSATLGITLPERPNFGPMVAWKRLAPYLGYDTKKLKQIADYYKGRNEEDLAASPAMRRKWKRDTAHDYRAFIRPYEIIPREQEGLMAKTKAGDEFTFATALVEYSESDFINHLDSAGTWEVVKNNNPPAFFRAGRNQKDINIIFYKCMVYTLMAEVVKTRNLEYRQQGKDITLVLKGMDDHWGFVRTIVALIDNLEMHMPQSCKEASMQGEVSLIDDLSKKLPNSDINFGSSLAESS